MPNTITPVKEPEKKEEEKTRGPRYTPSDRPVVNDTVANCQHCGSHMKPLISTHCPAASEYYCEKCDISYYMTKSAYKAHTMAQQQFRKQQSPVPAGRA